MTGELKNFNNNSKHLIILALSLLAIIFTTKQQLHAAVGSQKRNNRSNITRRYHFNNTTAASTRYKRQLVESGMDLTLMRAITTKTLTALFATIMWLSMILPSNLFAEDDGELSPDNGDSGDSGNSGDSGDNGDSSDSGGNSDDGYIYPDNSTPEEQKQIDKNEQKAYNDAGQPGKDQANNNNPEPYCNTPEGRAAPSCHDILDYDQKTGLYPCNDGTQKADPKDCKDATNKNLPICKYNVVKDCVVNKLGQKCLVGTDEDVCNDVFYGYKGSTHNTGEKTFNRGSTSNNSPQHVPDTPRTTSPTQKCDTSSHVLDLKIADMGKTWNDLDTNSSTMVTNYNADVDQINSEIQKFNAECYNSPAKSTIEPSSTPAPTPTTDPSQRILFDTIFSLVSNINFNTTQRYKLPCVDRRLSRPEPEIKKKCSYRPLEIIRRRRK
jgi:hypothetical protein